MAELASTYSLLAYREPGRTWYALAQGEQIIELHPQADKQPQYTDCQFEARVKVIDKAIASAFIELNDGQRTLGLMKLPKKQQLTEGQKLFVKCLGEPRDGKGPKVKQADFDKPLDLACVGDRLVHRYAIDTATTNSPSEAARLRQRWPGLTSHFDPKASWNPLQDCIDESRRDRIDLGGGAWLLFEPGETLTAIDLNSGPLAFEQANALAVPALARQIRHRNVGGLIILDALQLETKPQRSAFDKALRLALKDDPCVQEIGPINPQGIVIIHRRRLGLSINEALEVSRFQQASDASKALDSLAHLKRQAGLGDPQGLLSRTLLEMIADKVGLEPIRELLQDLGLNPESLELETP